MRKKFSKKYLKIIFTLFIVCLMINNDVWAALTTYSNATNNNVLTTISKVITEIGKFGMNVGTASLAMLLSGIAIVLFVVLQTVFALSGTTTNILQIPFPDTVVFNKMPLFDANFINPVSDSASPIYAIRTVISSIYDSFVIIAIAVFTIIAMVMGIKLALATLASEKAKYKQAIGSWIAGIILLVCLKWVLAGLFKINESIVQAAYNVSTTSNMSFEVLSIANIPYIGSTISQIVSWFGGNASAVSWGNVPGYLGLVLKYLLEGIGGNFLGSMVAFVVLGQTIAIVVVYLKRVFYCLLLGIVGPLIIAVDTLNRSMGKNSTILANWFKQLAVTIYMQSFHAIFMLVIIRFMVSIGNSVGNQYMSSLMIIILTTGLIKFEKIFKQLFGIGESVMGDLKGGAMKAFAAMGAVAKAGSAIGDNKKKLDESKKRKASLVAAKNKLEQRQNILKASRAGGSNAADEASSTIMKSAKDAVEGTAEVEANKTAHQTVSKMSSMDNGDEVKSLLRSINSQLMRSNDMSNSAQARNLDFQIQDNDEQLKDYDRQIAQAESDIASARFAKYAAPANIAAGVAFGLGMDDVASGALLTTGLDHASEKVGRRGADATRSRMYDKSVEEGREDVEILREKSTTKIVQNITDFVTLKGARDAATILTGKYDSGSESSKPRTVKNYRYVEDRRNRGHQTISSSVDNIND